MCGSIENYFDELERMAEGKERERDETVYTEDIWVPLAYENGVFSSYDGFPKNELLPPSCKSGNQGDFYLVMPLHHQEYCFGYCVVGNYRPALEGRFFRHFILSLDNALETVRRQDTMNAMLGRLSKMWLYDELTGVNNRAGYNKFAPRILEEAQKKQLPIAVIFADMDGLKNAVIRMLAREQIPIQTGTFENDMTTFVTKDDVLTLLIHLGYLAYDGDAGTVRIPNEEIRIEFSKSVREVKSSEACPGFL